MATLQESIPGPGSYNGGPSTTQWIGECWQAQASYVLTTISYKGFRHQSYGSDGTIRICLYACDYKGMPIGSELDHADMALANFPAYPSYATVTFTFTGNVLISKNCRYIWYAKYLGGTGLPYHYEIGSGYTHGSHINTSDSGVTWTSGTFDDSGLVGEIWGNTVDAIVTATATPSAFTANGNGTIVGAAAVDQYGFDWTPAVAGTEPPTFSYSSVAAGSPGATYVTLMSSLAASTWYWCRPKIHLTAYGWLYGPAVIFQTTLDPALALYEYKNTSPTGQQYTCGQYWTYMTFTPAISHNLQAVRLNLYGSQAVLPAGLVYVYIYATSGGKPTGSPLATAIMPASQVTTTTTTFYAFGFGTGLTVTAAVMYAIVLAYPAGSYATPCVYWRWGAGYSGGAGGRSQNSGSTWLSPDGFDALFEEYGQSGVETYAASDIQAFQATGNGFLLDATGIDQFGMEWSDPGFPWGGTYPHSVTATPPYITPGLFSMDMTGLTPIMTYYYRAKVHHTTYGWLYGNQMTFMTTPPSPLVRTDPPTDATLSTIDAVGYITSIGAGNATERGFVYDVVSHSDPTTYPANNIKKETGSFGVGSFTLQLTSLQAKQRYYVRAYATNPYGTAYGGEIIVLTSVTVNLLYPTSDYSKGIRFCHPGGDYPANAYGGGPHYLLVQSRDGAYVPETPGGPGFGYVTGTRAYEHQYWNPDYFSDEYGLSNPIRRTGTIIKVKWKAHLLNNGYGIGPYFWRLLRTGGTLYTGAAISTGDICEIFYTNPFTGLAWTIADCDALIAGLKIYSGSGWEQPSLDSLEVRVCWVNASVQTDSPTMYSGATCRLNGTILEDEAEDATVSFEYGTTIAYGSTTTPQLKTNGGTFYADVSGLNPALMYHYRAKLVTACGETYYGADKIMDYDFGAIILEQAYSIGGVRQSIFSTSPTWTEITSYLISLDTNRGRLHELARVEAGTAVFMLKNATGNFWRYNSAGAFYPDIKPLTLTRLRYRYAGIYYPLWYGVSESYNPGWMVEGEAGHTPIMTMGCVDFFKTFNRFFMRGANPALTADAHTGEDFVYVDSLAELHVGQTIKIYDGTNSENIVIQNIVVSLNLIIFTTNLVHDYGSGSHLKKWPSVLSGTRFHDLMIEMGFPLALTAIDAGQCMLVEFTPDADGTNIMEHIYDVVESEDGLAFVSAAGIVTYQDALARTKSPYNTSQGTFRDNDTDSKYVHPQLADDDTFIYNTGIISGDTIGTIIFQDTAKQAEQGARALRHSNSQLANSGDAFNQACIAVLRYSDSILRCDHLLIKPQASPANLFPIVLGWDISTRLTFLLNNTLNPAMVNLDYHVEGINHKWSMIGGEPNLWKTKFQLWNVNKYLVSPALHDGYLLNVNDTVDYMTCHNAAATTVPASNDVGYVEVGQWDTYAGAIWLASRIERGMMKFNTSNIAAGDTILEAYLIVYVGMNYYGRDWSLTLVSPSTVDNPLVDTDYHVLLGSTTSWGSVAMSGLVGWVAVPLNALGIAAISKGPAATTRFGLRSDRDIAADDPGANLQEWAHMWGVGSAYPPRLIVRIA